MSNQDHWTQHAFHGSHPPQANDGNTRSKTKAFFSLTVKKFRFREARFRRAVKRVARKAEDKAKDKFEALFYKD